MTSINPPRWLQWAREIQALAQTGCHYATGQYDRERYQRLMEIAAEIIADHSRVPYAKLLDGFRAQIGYATPRIDVRGAVFRDDRLLLVKERLDGGWTMPGGWADVGDTPAESVEREVLEEAGLRVKANKVIGVYDANRAGPLELFHAFKIVFLCDLISGEPRPSVETSEVAFFGHSEIPMQFSGERTSLRHIQHAFAAVAEPERPTQFD
jgi:ADP-ribose pyrophosphatase YjhB (NUDIX family)